ncbi:hypothetical protein ACFL6I_00665 [candidate division KSB1 bacterium]
MKHSYRSAVPKNVFVIVPLAVLTILLYAVSTVSAQVPVIGKQAPDFSLPTLDGGQFTLSELIGTKNAVVVTVRGWVGFW